MPPRHAQAYYARLMMRHITLIGQLPHCLIRYAAEADTPPLDFRALEAVAAEGGRHDAITIR